MAGQWPISSPALHRRPPFARAPGLSVPPGLEGYAPGTPALPQIRPHREAGAAELTSVPPDYRWDGTGTAPPSIYQLAVAIACMFGQPAAGLPAADAPGAAEFVGATYAALTAAGLSHDDIYSTIAALAPAGPQAIANALAQKIQHAGHGDLIRGCAPAAPHPTTRPPTLGDPTPRPTVRHSPPMLGDPPPKPAPAAPPAVVVAPAPAPVVISRPVAPPEAKSGTPWGWILGGVGLLAAIGVGWYFATRKPKRRNPPASLLEVRGNPCASCSNPSDVIDTEGEEVRENPYSGTRGYSSVDPSIMAYSAELGMSPMYRTNPSKRKRRNPPGKRRGKA